MRRICALRLQQNNEVKLCAQEKVILEHSHETCKLGGRRLSKDYNAY